MVFTSESPVRAGRFDRAGDLGDVPVGRGELRVKGQRGGRTAGGDDLMRRVCGFLERRAGQVELDGDILEPGTGLGVVGGAEPANRDPQRNAQLAQTGQVLGQCSAGAVVMIGQRRQHARDSLSRLTGGTSR